MLGTFANAQAIRTTIAATLMVVILVATLLFLVASCTPDMAGGPLPTEVVGVGLGVVQGVRFLDSDRL